ncbi:unnamed protein product [Laminaria digitata]
MLRTHRDSDGRKSAGVLLKLVASLLSTVALIIIQAKTGFWTRTEKPRYQLHGQQTGSLGQNLRRWTPGNASDMAQERRAKSWAGVYVDSATNEVLHLEPDGGATISPGTSAADTRWNCLRWWTEDDALHLVDCDGRPFTWLGVDGHVWRDSMQAAKIVGFGAEATTDGDEISGNGMARLVRDPFGFMFPGCAYLFSMLQRSPRSTMHEVRVVINHDGSVIEARSGEAIASWSFAARNPLLGLGDESWATGDAVVLLIDTSYLQSLGFAAPAEGDEDLEFALFTSDGGRTWLPVDGQRRPSASMFPAEYVGLDEDKSVYVTLDLEAPTDVSLLPLTAAMLPLTTYLQMDHAGGLLVDDQDSVATGINKLQPIYQVLEAQPFRLSGQNSGYGDTARDLEAVIVISKAVPRPAEGRADLACVINGVEKRAVWLSWSMVICSVANVKPDETTLYISYQGSPLSTDSSFLHTPPPRHTRLGWPASEHFDVVPARHSWTPAGADDPRIFGSNGGQSVDTTLALCTMFKDEAPYLEEWLQYHWLLGVSKVYMYDNGSLDNSRALLKKYESSGFVHVRDWRHEGAQTEALNDCLCRFRHTTRWMTFIDVDEFMDSAPGLPIQAAGNVSEEQASQLDFDHVKFSFYSMAERRKLLQKRLHEWGPKRHTQCMPWVNYCSSGQLSKSPGGITENYLQLEDMGEPKIHMQKPLFKAMEALTLRRIGPHFLLYATEGIDLQYQRNLRCPYDWLDSRAFQLRHYRSKSLEEYVRRRMGADSAYKGKHYTREQLTLEWHETTAHCGKKGR